jgi:hypothetical protein
MTPVAESVLVEKRKLSTGHPLNGGKLLLIWWIRSELRKGSGFFPGCPLVRPFVVGGGVEEPDLWTNPGAIFGRRMRQPGL